MIKRLWRNWVKYGRFRSFSTCNVDSWEIKSLPFHASFTDQFLDKFKLIPVDARDQHSEIEERAFIT